MATETAEPRNANGQGLKTCLVTLVEPGRSDRVIKVFPAEHESEKIWLDRTQGIERWEAVRRVLYNYAERGSRVPDPAPWHANPADLRTVTLREADIPLVRLDGIVLNKPPEEERFDPFKNSAPSILEVNERMNKMEGVIGSLAQAVSQLTTALAAKPAAAVAQSGFMACDQCQQPFFNKKALGMHKRRKHPEVK